MLRAFAESSGVRARRVVGESRIRRIFFFLSFLGLLVVEEEEEGRDCKALRAVVKVAVIEAGEGDDRLYSPLCCCCCCGGWEGFVGGVCCCGCAGIEEVLEGERGLRGLSAGDPRVGSPAVLIGGSVLIDDPPALIDGVVNVVAEEEEEEDDTASPPPKSPVNPSTKANLPSCANRPKSNPAPRLASVFQNSKSRSQETSNTATSSCSSTSPCSSFPSLVSALL